MGWLATCAAVCGVFVSGAGAQQCGIAGADAMIDVTDVANYTPSGTYDAIVLGAYVCNTGSTSFTYSGCPNVHPIFGSNLYRYSTVNGAGRFEQIGQSWLKHTAVAANSSDCCTCVAGSGTGLRPGCADLYSSGFQSAQSTLGPRYQVNAFTGDFALCPSHPSGGNFGRLEFALTDGAATAGGANAATRFVIEEQVIVREDAAYSDAATPVGSRGWNNASSAELTMTGAAANWTAARLGATQKGVAGIQWWKQIDPGVTETFADVPGEGRFIVSSKATSLGGSPAMWRYEYAVFNLNSDRCAGSFAVPGVSGTVANIGFHSVVYRGGDGVGAVNVDGTPWTGAMESGSLVWRTTDYAVNPNANAIRWSTLSNFRFDSSSPPAPSGSVTIGLWKPGAPGYPASVLAAAQVPGCVAPTITTQPVPAMACPTGAATFSVVASGAGTLSYAWQVQTASDVWQTLGNDPFPMSCGSGASGSAYAGPILSPAVSIGIRPCAGVGSYQVRCVVSDASGCGSVTSNAVTYTICPADFNCSNTLSVQDIFDFLNAWFAGDARTDFDHDNSLLVADIFAYLNAWFVGC
jgi:hypothetical protein